jgi:hypothetical protein
MSIGDPIEVCRPVVTGGGRIEQRWFPATIAKVDQCSIVAVFADHSRREYQPNPHVIRPMSR